MKKPVSSPRERAGGLAARLARLPEVAAVALGGSQASGAADAESDIDLYVYTSSDIAPEKQKMLIDESGGAVRADIGLPYWGGVSVWIDAPTGIAIDCMYFATEWIEAEVARVMEAHEPSLGCSTCFCRTVATSHGLYDPNGWLAALQARCAGTYPEPLRQNIIAHNHPVLRGIITSYLYRSRARCAGGMPSASTTA